MLNLSNLEKILNTQPTRRGFILTMLYTGAGCAFTSHIKQGYNPNFSGPGRFYTTFATSSPWTPSIAWKVRNPTPIHAAARGVINDARKPKQKSGHAGGYHIILKHADDLRDASDFSPGFYSRYIHLNKIERKNGIVERGELLGYAGQHYNVFSFAFKEHGNYVNPDEWGPGHGYMDYWDGRTNLEATDIIKKSHRQLSLLKKLHNHYIGIDRKGLLQRIFRKGYFGVSFWSTVEIWRHMMNKGPESFNVSESILNEMNEEFYANQPMILTFPFKPRSSD